MKALACTVGAVLLGLGAAANAGSLTWNFSFAATLDSPTDTDSGSGVITTSDTLSGGSYTITGVTGSVTGVSGAPVSSISGLDLYQGADNLLFPSSSQPLPFDFNGFSFVLANGTELNLFADGSNIYECTSALPTACNGPGAAFQTTSFSVTENSAPVPLPDSLGMLGLGLVGLGVFAGFGRGQRSVGLAA